MLYRIKFYFMHEMRGDKESNQYKKCQLASFCLMKWIVYGINEYDRLTLRDFDERWLNSQRVKCAHVRREPAKDDPNRGACKFIRVYPVYRETNGSGSAAFVFRLSEKARE